MQLPIGERPIGQREIQETKVRGEVHAKIMRSRSEGRMLVVWNPSECEAMKDLLARLKRLEGEE